MNETLKQFNIIAKIAKIDGLLGEVGESLRVESARGESLFAKIDQLCREIDIALETRIQEVKGWPVERKREEAVDSKDTFVLNLLSMDENFNVRILSACNPNTPANSLLRLAEGADDYVLMVIANNPASTPEILNRICDLSRQEEVLHAVIGHPNVSQVTKYRIENRM